MINTMYDAVAAPGGGAGERPPPEHKYVKAELLVFY